MAASVHTYYFARLNLLGVIRGNKVDFIMEGLNAQNHHEERDFRYSFLEVQRLEYDGELFAFGLLVKYKRLLEGELVDESEKRIVDGGLEFGVVAKAPFFLHFASMLTSYRPVTNRISDEQFRRIFSRLLKMGHDDFFLDAALLPITEEQGILEAIESFQKIQWLTLDLRPTNPDNTPEFRSVDERIKQLEAKRYREELIGGDGGLNRQALVADEAYKGVVMAQHGYGTATLHGVNSEGREVTISTASSPTTVKVSASDSPQQLLEEIFGTLRRLIAKGSHEQLP